MTDEEYLAARGWEPRQLSSGKAYWVRANRRASLAEAVETQIAEDRAVAGYLAARGVPAGYMIAVSSSGGVAGGGSGAAIVSRVSGPVGFTGGAPQGLTRVVSETFVEAAQTLARLALKVDTRMVDPASWKALRDAAETVDALDRKPR